MTRDPIIEEIHAIREEISREAGDDLHQIAERARRRQRESADERPVVRLAPRPARPQKKAS